LFPVAAYLLFLAIINGRNHPTIISGPWDFVGVLFATSGFWIVGGPVMLALLHARWRPAFVQGDMTELAIGEWSFVWALAWVLYFALIFFGSAILLWWRRRCTLVYNVEPALLDDAMNQAFARVGLSTVRIGNRILFQPLPSEKKQELTE